jgi:hypothetical protein
MRRRLNIFKDILSIIDRYIHKHNTTIFQDYLFNVAHIEWKDGVGLACKNYISLFNKRHCVEGKWSHPCMIRISKDLINLHYFIPLGHGSILRLPANY